MVRFPFKWERMQRTLEGALHADELARLKSVVSYITGKGKYHKYKNIICTKYNNLL